MRRSVVCSRVDVAVHVSGVGGQHKRDGRNYEGLRVVLARHTQHMRIIASPAEANPVRLVWGFIEQELRGLKSTSTLTEHLGVLTLASRFRCIVHSQHSHLTVSEVFSSDGEKDSPIIPQMLHSRA